ncbi:cytidylyltransferase domain-containing protein [Flavobacterium sp. KBS0721]|uniref:acylneuraminate cytidylyltransferase family protein n=1 Tax=Flavobacterium sp. KBS0721 TaxID=1179672 RepID=UPI00098E96D8|nr:acylneuraminate cytidylyltransferase family protein [Flavobacterium sp. KBS0721]QDW18851.1 acylneuraminate cytidylyltransferase family protein [Flavobacterium sp. KBS0721]
MKNIAIIPARGGSKRLPQKNIKLLDGFPLLSFSILFAQANSEIIDEIYVSTDDEAIKNIALKYGAKVIDRPKDLSGDLEPTVSALKHVLQSIDSEVDNVVLLQATNPIRPKNLLKESFEIYQKENSNSLFTVSRNHKKFGKITDQKFIPYNYKIGQRSQDIEPLYFENGLLYITKASLIHEDIIISEDAFPFEIDHIFASVDIDTQEDFDYAEYLYHKHIKP